MGNFNEKNSNLININNSIIQSTATSDFSAIYYSVSTENPTVGVIITNNSTIKGNCILGGKTTATDSSFIGNISTVTISNVTFERSSIVNNSAANSIYLFRNYKGTVTFKDSTFNSVINTSRIYTGYEVYGIDNVGAMIIENSTFTFNDRFNTFYGITNESADSSIEFKSGSINMTGLAVTGVRLKGGSLVLGEKEAEDSPNYGKETANVSVTNPSISAIGTYNGYGIKNASGYVEFYDGIIKATSQVITTDFSKVEYLYQPEEEVTTTSPVVKSQTLKFMRNN